MGENTKIQWAHHTFNPWLGCSKVGPGCDNCYAEADFDHRRHVVRWGTGQPRKHTQPSTWAKPHKWNNDAHQANALWMGLVAVHGGEGNAIAAGCVPYARPRVFCASLADIFDNEINPAWRVELLKLIRDTPHLDWLLLTKRIGNAQEMLDAAMMTLTAGVSTWLSGALPNVWLGATVVNQAEAKRDIPKLISIVATKWFLSIEPMLGAIDLNQLRFKGACSYDALNGVLTQVDPVLGVPKHIGRLAKLSWVICGGESGKHARPMHPDWVRALRDQCLAADVPFFFKQWGTWSEETYPEIKESDRAFTRALADSTLGARAWTPGDCLIKFDGQVFESPNAMPSNSVARQMRRGSVKANGNHIDGKQHEETPA
jgi:protein gp37